MCLRLWDRRSRLRTFLKSRNKDWSLSMGSRVVSNSILQYEVEEAGVEYLKYPDIDAPGVELQGHRLRRRANVYLDDVHVPAFAVE